MDPKNGVDILEGLGAGIIIVFGAMVIFYEFDLFYTVYYFFCKPKTVIKSVLNILCNFSLALVFAYFYLLEIFTELRLYETIPLILFLTYIVLRAVYTLISLFSADSSL